MNDISPPVACLLNLDGVRKMYEAAWRDGFRNGADHGNLDYKYPPEDIAWLEHKKSKHDLFVCLTREELKAIEKWNDASYEARTDEVRWNLDPEETEAEQSNVRDHRAGPSDQGKAEKDVVAGSGASTCWVASGQEGKANV